ncbi:enoyl-CoA hydratase [soil metagenome]
MTEYDTIQVDRRGRVGWITLHRPEALNALNTQLMRDVVQAGEELDSDEHIGVIVITGGERIFAAGADIKEMESKSGLDVIMSDHFGGWARFAGLRKPIVAAVSGLALGGGCELAMMCDIIIAADNARFGQPEINLGVIPGLGGTQRLLRAVGYYTAADMLLTGRLIDAAEAERAGLVSRVVPAADLFAEATKVAEVVASKSLPSVLAAKAALRAAMETSLAEGLRFEKQAFASMFDTVDQKEGMAAFREKRPPVFKHR